MEPDPECDIMVQNHDDVLIDRNMQQIRQDIQGTISERVISMTTKWAHQYKVTTELCSTVTLWQHTINTTNMRNVAIIYFNDVLATNFYMIWEFKAQLIQLILNNAVTFICDMHFEYQSVVDNMVKKKQMENGSGSQPEQSHRVTQICDIISKRYNFEFMHVSRNNEKEGYKRVNVSNLAIIKEIENEPEITINDGDDNSDVCTITSSYDIQLSNMPPL
ncbi:17685_t:CDS:2 [Acaulospora morrowiae]|uniref:17685_t:CDS:1 n=1 Tax=Acaulospora morrowiae TaxID=94023 RepID=A0A9N8YNQ8_9GLOM|nr:17685_t:CDS:2 [Acaulospora morrowiae]